MSNNESADSAGQVDGVANLHANYQTLLSAYKKEGPLSKKDRKRYLKRLKKELIARKDEFADAISKDFRGRAKEETSMADILPVVSSIRYILKNLDEWMSVQPVESALIYWPARLEVRPQALGVVGVISPWNYPVGLCLGPLCDAIAAGNRVILKPSEHVANTSALLKDFVSSVFPESVACVSNGAADVAIALSKLPLNHLLYTGSVAVGKKVMAAASENLTPITLELGGKSPAIIHPSYNLKRAADKIAFGKSLNAGQTCIAPDYVLCPKDKVHAFVDAFKSQILRRFSSFENNDDFTAIVNDQQRDRLLNYLADAKEKGAEIIQITGEKEEFSVKMPPTLVLNPTDEMSLMQEEIFGPILPIVPYDTFQDALDYVNTRPRPLALYYFDTRRKRIDALLENTVSGGVCINETMIHFIQDELPFGGVGSSGLGRYRGRYGFETFSHYKPVLRQSRFSMVPLITTQPYSKWVRWVIKAIIGR